MDIYINRFVLSALRPLLDGLPKEGRESYQNKGLGQVLGVYILVLENISFSGGFEETRRPKETRCQEDNRNTCMVYLHGVPIEIARTRTEEGEDEDEEEDEHDVDNEEDEDEPKGGGAAATNTPCFQPRLGKILGALVVLEPRWSAGKDFQIKQHHVMSHVVASWLLLRLRIPAGFSLASSGHFGGSPDRPKYQDRQTERQTDR